MKKPLIILTGPTAVGKTALSIKLAQRIGGEIISADSMQVYRKMDIGTAKIKACEMQGIRHHMIDILDADEEFNVVVFQKKAREHVEEINSRGLIPIITGGTGFYIQALLYDINFTNEASDEICENPSGGNAAGAGGYRAELEALAALKGSEYLHNLLKGIDEAAAEAIHANNHRRIIRALEYHHQTGNLISLHNETEKQRKSPYNFTYFVLNNEREKIYENINRRVDEMIADGLIDEVKNLRESGLSRLMVSMQGLGYKEIFAYLDGEVTLEEAVTLLKRDTRRFAKRQLTWFRREKEVIWLNKADYHSDDEIVEEMMRVISGKLKV
ncbi:MAG: tRNA (adenosine(37)-N6)-dimethylallyltransferase MiaA [Lachnospiraceae bacterium]|nr:tRNA (adenosine(37)-N6)-dimethylallyltransferase MiaA [Lachnospiraceae bacterium]